MDPFELVIAVLTFFSVILIPILVVLIRGAVKWTRTEDKLGELVDDMKTLVRDKDKVHSEILEQMRLDRDATDRRLRFIEEFWMMRGRDTFLAATPATSEMPPQAYRMTSD